MIFSHIDFKNFKIKKKSSKLKKYLKFFLKKKDNVISSLGNDYKFSFDKKNIIKYKKFSNYRIIGMGGSSLGAQAIFNFLKRKIKKNFIFIDNLENENFRNNKTKFLNLIISKSGDTLETIINANILVKKPFIVKGFFLVSFFFFFSLSLHLTINRGLDIVNILYYSPRFSLSEVSVVSRRSFSSFSNIL